MFALGLLLLKIVNSAFGWRDGCVAAVVAALILRVLKVFLLLFLLSFALCEVRQRCISLVVAFDYILIAADVAAFAWLLVVATLG